MTEQNQNITIIEDIEWIQMPIKLLKRVAETYFDLNFKQRAVINIHTGFRIILAKKGFDHTLKCNDWSYENLIVFKKLDEVIRNSNLIDIGLPDEEEKKKGTKLFYNFHSMVIINGNEHKLKITIREHIEPGKNGKILKFYYDHYKLK
jgi:hypothetical protein